jgi:Fuc2NAc and GlcNAc transferase
MIAGVGFWDDHKHIPARWRLLVHFCASALALWSMTELPAPYFFGYSLYNSWVLGGFYLLGLVWMLNLYNFMDGIDGIASIEAITVLIGAVILLWMHGAYLNYIFVFVAFAFAIAGFLVWNFPPAKIFMGDACSGFLGFTLGIIAIMNSSFEMFIGFHPQGINIWTWLVLLGVFICDATFTLIKRILNKEVWYEAHSSHAYQYYARLLIKQFQQQGFDSHNARTKSHRRVNFQMTLINVLWLFPLAAITTFYPYWAFLITVMAYLPLLFIANQLKAGITE